MTPNSLVVLKHTFTAVRVFDYSLSPVTFALQIHCCIPGGVSPTVHSTQDKAAVSFQVLKLWMQNMLEEVTLVNPLSEVGEFLLGVSENKTMTIPGEPDDNILVQVLYSKISAITKGHLDIIKVVLSSTDTDDTEQHLIITKDFKNSLPDISYMEDDVVHATPWWDRVSIDIADVYKHLLSEEEINDILTNDDVLQEYEEMLLQDIVEQQKEENEAEIIEDVWKT